MKFTRTQIILIGFVLLIVILAILLFTGIIPGLRSQGEPPLTGEITVWGVFDSAKVIEDSLIADFNAVYPGVTVTYIEKNPTTYEIDLINALAAGTGPDVYMIKNTWLRRHFDKLSPLPPENFSVEGFKSNFAEVAAKDFVLGGQVYALPLYIDSLAMYYNRAMLDSAGISEPPTTWEEFNEMVPQLRKFDSGGRIFEAAAAIGGSNRNISNAVDLATLIMMQYGVQMTDEKNSKAIFARDAIPAINFYTSFSNPTSPTYTWDSNLHYSIDAFAQEKVAIIFNYGHQARVIQDKNPFLDFVISPMLQPEEANRDINYADYWGFGVTKTTSRPDIAWSFVFASTLDPVVSANYLNTSFRSPALRSLISSMTDREKDIFAKQALTAASWSQINEPTIDTILSRMLDLIVGGQLTAESALRQAEEQITSLMEVSTKTF